MEGVNFAGVNLIGDRTFAHAIFNDEVEYLEFIKEVDIVLDALLVERLQNHVAGAVGGVACTAHRGFTIVARVAAKGALGNLPFGCAVEGQAHVLQLDDHINRLAAHNFNGVLVAQIVRPLDGVVGVPFPMVFFMVAQCGADTTLGSACVRTSRIQFAQHGGVGGFGGVQSRHQTGTAGTNHEHIILECRHRILLLGVLG